MFQQSAEHIGDIFISVELFTKLNPLFYYHKDVEGVEQAVFCRYFLQQTVVLQSHGFDSDGDILQQFNGIISSAVVVSGELRL